MYSALLDKAAFQMRLQMGSKLYGKVGLVDDFTLSIWLMRALVILCLGKAERREQSDQARPDVS